MKLSTNELLHRRWDEALPGDRATRDGVIYQLSEKGEWLYVEDPYDGQSIRAHKDHTIEAQAVAAERARIVAGVEGLPVFAFSLYDDGTDNRLTIGKAAVLRIIEAEAVVAHGSHCDAEYRRDSCVCADAAERSDR